MSYFKAKMHQVRFRLQLCPRPRWGSSQRSPSPAWDLRGSTSKGRRKGKEKGGGEERKRGKVRGKAQEGGGEEQGGYSAPPPWLKPRSATGSKDYTKRMNCRLSLLQLSSIRSPFKANQANPPVACMLLDTATG